MILYSIRKSASCQIFFCPIGAESKPIKKRPRRFASGAAFLRTRKMEVKHARRQHRKRERIDFFLIPGAGRLLPAPGYIPRLRLFHLGTVQPVSGQGGSRRQTLFSFPLMPACRTGTRSVHQRKGIFFGGAWIRRLGGKHPRMQA